MRLTRLSLLLALLAAPIGVAQQAGDKDNGPPPAAAPPAPAPAPGPENAGERASAATDAPPLRDDYEPRERISRDKAASFPPDI